MKKFWNTMLKIIPHIWGTLWVALITLLSVWSVVAVIKLLIKVFGW